MKIFFLISTLFLAIACSKATPKTEQMKLLSGLAVTTPNANIKKGEATTLSGTCTKVFESIEVSFDQGTTWNNLIAIDSNQSTKCTSTGTFSASIDSSSSSISPYLVSSPPELKVLVRGISEFGKSTTEQMLISINYATATASPGNSVVSGSHSGTSGVGVSAVNIKGHIKSFGVSELVSLPSGMKLKGSVTK